MDGWAIVAAVFFAAFVVVVVQRDRARAELEISLAVIARQTRELRLRTPAPPFVRRKPEEYPPGTVPAELAQAVNEAWKSAGFAMMGDQRAVLRLLSIAHRVMCEFQPASYAPAHFNDGDRYAPASVRCQAGRGGSNPIRCHYPACQCPAIDGPEPPPLPKSKAPGAKP